MRHGQVENVQGAVMNACAQYHQNFRIVASLRKIFVLHL